MLPNRKSDCPKGRAKGVNRIEITNLLIKAMETNKKIKAEMLIAKAIKLLNE